MLLYGETSVNTSIFVRCWPKTTINIVLSVIRGKKYRKYRNFGFRIHGITIITKTTTITITRIITTRIIRTRIIKIITRLITTITTFFFGSFLIALLFVFPLLSFIIMRNYLI